MLKGVSSSSSSNSRFNDDPLPEEPSTPAAAPVPEAPAPAAAPQAAPPRAPEPSIPSARSAPEPESAPPSLALAAVAGPTPPPERVAAAAHAPADAEMPNAPNANTQTAAEPLEPLVDRLPSRDWKTRRDAYTELKTLFSEAAGGVAPVFSEFSHALCPAARESSAGALDAALDAICAYAEHVTFEAEARALAVQIAPLVIDNALAARAGSARKGTDVLLKFIECDTPPPIVSALLDALTHKKPKVPPACVECITACLQAFGRVEFPVASVTAKLRVMFDSSSAPLRKAATALTVELHGLFGDVISSPAGPLKDIKPALLKEVLAKIESATPESTPQLREFIGLRSASGGSGSGGGGRNPSGRTSGTGAAGGQPAGDAPPALDAWDIAPFVDLIGALKALKFNTQSLHDASLKWGEKKAALEVILQAIGPLPKLAAPTDETKPAMSELVKDVRALSADSHQAVATAAVRVLGALACGLRLSFGPYALGVFRALLARLKDQKARAVVSEALDAIFPHALKFDEKVTRSLASDLLSKA